MRIEIDVSGNMLRVVMRAVIGGWIGMVVGAIATIPLSLIFSAIVFMANDYRGDLTEYVIAFTVATGMGLGAICGGISGPIIAVLIMNRRYDSDNADDSGD